MIMDGLLLLDGSLSGAVLTPTTVNSGTTFVVGNQASANVIDLSQLASSAKGYGRDIGVGDGLWIVCLIATTFTGTGATLQVNIQYAPDNGSGSPGTYVTMVSSAVYTVSQLVAGTEIMRVEVPPVSPSNLGMVPKFMQATYTVGTANMTAGALITSIVIDRTALGPYLGYQSGYSNQYV
jgi:hypothetical protein